MAASSPPLPPQRALPQVGRMGPGLHFVGETRKPHDRRGTLRKLWAYLRRQQALIAVAVVMVCASAGLDVLAPYLLGRAIDRGLTHHNLAALKPVIGLMLGVYALSAALNWLQSVTMVTATQRAVRDIRTDLFARLQQLPLPFFDKRAHGD